MEIILTVAQVVAPVFALAAIGWLWVRAGHDFHIDFVTRLTMTISVPCLIFTALVKADLDPAALRALTLAALVAYAGVAALCWGLVALGRLDRRTYLAPLIFGNTGNIGLPLALFAFGDIGLGYAVVVFAVMAVLSFTVGVWLVSGGGSLAKVVQEPIVAATLLGALFLWRGWMPPEVVMNTLSLVGQMAIPVMLITLGVAIARLSAANLGRAALLSTAKVAICAGAAYAAGRWFGLAPVPLAVLVVQVSTPVAVTSYLLAQKYGAKADAVAGLVVVSTLGAVLYLPILLGLFM